MRPGLLETRFYAAYGIPAFAYGPGLLTVSHGPNEFVPIPNIAQCVAIYALTAVGRLPTKVSAVRPFSEPHGSPKVKSSAKLPQENKSQMKVFIVEDAPQTRQELVELFAAEKSFEVVGQAGSVHEALTGIEATGPEAVTLDISLPDGSGIEVLKHIRKRGWDLCVVVLTGNPYEGLRAKCQQLGAVAVLDKFNGLAQTVRALLDARPGPETT